MKFVFAALIFWGVFAQAQLSLEQSSPSIHWKTISNDQVQVIYPDYLGIKATYIANLVDHYSHFVGKTYGYDRPDKFTLIVRPEAAEPNGFVTLQPRRSEWYSASTFFPYVGTSEWYQTLASHEYRHVVQFDHYQNGITRFFYWIMGDFGKELSMFLGVQSWYMEGDAVWSETKYTDAGRGRSPRFLARLKALVLSDKIPTYEQFVNGSYQTDLPNQYVYGFVLISNGTKKFGDDFWAKVSEDTAIFPHPYRFYSAFEKYSGQSFQDFYNETMNDLRSKWSKDAPPAGEEKVDYRENFYPYKSGAALYSLNSTLDTQWVLYKDENGKKEKVAELPFVESFTQFHIQGSHAVYTEFAVDARYGFKGTSDLILLDLNDGSHKRLTTDLRIYNAHLNESGTKIIATNFTKELTWNVAEFDLQGNLLSNFALPEGDLSEAAYLDETHAVAVVTSNTGHKSLVVLDLLAKKITKTLLPPSRNLLYGLSVDANKNIFFEAQYKGHTEIFETDSLGGFRQCTQSRIQASNAFSDGKTLYYSDMDTYGSHLANMDVSSCANFSSNELVDFKYLGENPSDNYNNFPLQAFPEQKDLYTKNADQYQPEDYGDFDRRLLIPHSWGLLLGRGDSLGFQTDNYLGTLETHVGFGNDPEEGTGYATFDFDVMKYYPIFQFHGENRRRSIDDYDQSTQMDWLENTLGLSMIIPYQKTYGLYALSAGLLLDGSYMNADNYQLNKVATDEKNYFYNSTTEFDLMWYKQPVQRSIVPPLFLSYLTRYDNAEQPSDSQYSGYRFFQEAKIGVPGVFKEDNLTFIYDSQKQDNSSTAYRFRAFGATPMSYVFSRGYNYFEVPSYEKVSANYLFPMAYPDFNAYGVYYLRRMYATLFYDSTRVHPTVSADTNLDSAGAEVIFESKFFRIIPLNVGLRWLDKIQDHQGKFEMFAASSLAF